MQKLRSRILSMKTRVDDLCDTPPSEQQLANARALASLIKPIQTLSGSQRNETGDIVISTIDFSQKVFTDEFSYIIQNIDSIEKRAALIERFPTTVEAKFHLNEWIENAFSCDRTTLISIKPKGDGQPIGFMAFRREISIDMYNHQDQLNQICHSISIDYVYIDPAHRNGFVSAALIKTVLNDVQADAKQIADLNRSIEIKSFNAPLHFRVHSDPISEAGRIFVERINLAINTILENTFSSEEISKFANSCSGSPAEPAY